MNDALIKAYAKKIYGFAYAKTNNCHDADDLSQEIVLSLCTITFDGRRIGNMDAYIYRVCRYTWSKYLRKNKPPAEFVGGTEFFDRMQSEDGESGGAEAREYWDRLRREIMFLGRIRREAIILFYYDGKSGDEISAILGIPAATVRWHLHRAKNELRERIEMIEQDTIYRPVKLNIGHYGWHDNDVMRQLETDMLMQNICYVCFDSALTIEEISRTLGVAAVYLENKLDKLTGMEYVTKSAKGKYRTNFFIRNARYQLEHNRYRYEKTLPLAVAYYNVVKAALPEIKALDIAGSGIGDGMLAWDFLLFFLSEEIGETDNRMIRTLGLKHNAPIRPDGSRHWLMAEIPADEVLAADGSGDEDFNDFYRTADRYGFKVNNLTPGNYRSLQFDSPFVSGWRTLSTGDMSAVKRIRELIRSGDEPNDFDKTKIAELIEKGYASRENGVLASNIPYFDAAQSKAVDEILKKYADAMLDREAADRVFTGYAEHMKKLIPACVCENERSHYLTSYDPYNAVFWLLMKDGLLKTPNETERKYICTVMWDY